MRLMFSLAVLSLLCACSQQPPTLGPRSVANAEVVADAQSDRPPIKPQSPKPPTGLDGQVHVEWVVPDEVVVVRLDQHALEVPAFSTNPINPDALELLTRGMRVALAEHRLTAPPILLDRNVPGDQRSPAYTAGLVLQVEPRKEAQQEE